MLIEIYETDPVTGMPDLFFMFTRSREICEALSSLYPDANIRSKLAA